MYSSYFAILERIARPAVAFYRQPNGAHLSWASQASQWPRRLWRVVSEVRFLSQGAFLPWMLHCRGGSPLGHSFSGPFWAYVPCLMLRLAGRQGGKGKSKLVGNRPVPCLERTTPCAPGLLQSPTTLKLCQEKKMSVAVVQITGVPCFPRIPRNPHPDFFPSHFIPCCAL